MQTIKCFVSRIGQADNTPNKTADFGELSTYARTFTRDIKIYTDPQHPDYEINVFSAKEAGKEMVGFNTAFTNLILGISKWAYDRSAVIDQDITKIDYLTELLNEFFDKIENPKVGAIYYSAGKTLPEYIKFRMVDAPGAANPTDPNEVAIWFSSAAFERDYDEFEITVVPPVDVLDTFFLPLAEIRQAVAKYSLVDMFEKIQKIRNKQPETATRAIELDYIYPADPNIKVNTTWGVLVYGAAGDNEEAIKQAMIDHILANSQQPYDNWKIIFPDLFRVTQMFVLPLWEKMAIPNRVTRVGIYSPISSPKDNLAYAKNVLGNLPTDHIDDNLESTHHKFRSITLLAVGGTDNTGGKFKLTDYIPDYIGESSVAEDFNRMSDYTRNWTVMMEELLILAEKINEHATLPVGTRRYTLDDQLYVGRRLGKIEYLVAVKDNVQP